MTTAVSRPSSPLCCCPDEDQVHSDSLRDPETFWARQAERLHWHKFPEAALRVVDGAHLDDRDTSGTVKDVEETHVVDHRPDACITWTWFPGGEISTCYNCVDRHVLAGNGSQVAIYYDSPVTGTKATFTYVQLLEEVEALAGALREEGVRRGDVVLVYMPMIPAALIAMLAANRLGAVHSTVFGGFAPAALAQRIDACAPAVVLTASCGIVGSRPPIPYRPLVEEAVALSAHKPGLTVVWQREQLRWDMDAATPAAPPTATEIASKMQREGERGAGGWLDALPRWLRGPLLGGWSGPPTGNTTPGLDALGSRQLSWQEWVGSAKARGVKAGCVAVKSDDPVYILYTSGTTGAPKGVRRDAGGHAVGLSMTIDYIFGIHGPGDVSFTASDIGWVVGHSYILYAPLLAGAATVLYEGKPVGTPDASAFWRVVEEYKVNTMFTAPTALRAIRQEDPHNQCLSGVGERGGLRSLKALFLAGERSESSLISHYQDLLNQYGAPFSSHVINNWWSTEAGSPITGHALAPHAMTKPHRGKACLRSHEPSRIKAGSVGKPMPAFDVRVVNLQGNEVPRGTEGNIALTLPLAPTAFRTLWNNDEGFNTSYLRKFGGKLLDTGDAGWMDKEGYVYVTSRNDDVLNVSAYRLSSGSIEEAISSHPLVVDCCVVGIPDKLKGQLPFAFVTLSEDDSAISIIDAMSEIQSLVRRQVGAFASLGGIVQGRGLIPKTRSGKTMRRVLRDLVENGVRGEFSKEVAVPSTVEDAAVVDAARVKIKQYFVENGSKHAPIEEARSRET